MWTLCVSLSQCCRRQSEIRRSCWWKTQSWRRTLSSWELSCKKNREDARVRRDVWTHRMSSWETRRPKTSLVSVGCSYFAAFTFQRRRAHFFTPLATRCRTSSLLNLRPMRDAHETCGSLRKTENTSAETFSHRRKQSRCSDRLNVTSETKSSVKFVQKIF